MPVPKSCWMLGTATFPAVTSRSAIPSPKLVATRVQRGDSPAATAARGARTADGARCGASSSESMDAWMHAALGRCPGFLRTYHAKTHVMADWQDIRTFLAVARAGTLAAAGRVLNVDYTTVGRRVRALEQELGLTLFERVRDRYVLTDAAEGLREAAERMEDGALALERRALGSDRTVSGVLRIATTDALAQILVLPALQALHERHPEIRVVLLTGGARLDIARREADVALRYVRPDAGELVSRRVARVAAAFYASPDYLARRPVPPKPDSFAGHDVVAPEAW